MPPVDDDDDAPAGFLSRWSRRKAQVRQGQAPLEPVPPPAPVARVLTPARPVRTEPMSSAASSGMVKPGDPVAGVTEAEVPAAAGAEPKPTAAVKAEPLPTLEDVAALPRGADVRRFVAPGVAPEVRNAALKKLFADPHFNIMDGLDTYIDDYGKPDPLPAGMLRQMVQSQMLGLFKDEQTPSPAEISAAAASTESDSPPAPNQADAAPNPPTAVEAAPDEDLDLRLQPHHAAGPGRPAPGTEPDPGRQR